MLTEEELRDVIKRVPLAAIDLIISRNDGKVLLGLRRNEPAKNWWFIQGGRIAKNETLDAAFARIYREEVGSTAIKEKYRAGIFEHIYTTNRFGDPGFGTHYVVVAYHIRVDDIPLEKLPRDQHSDYKWSTPDELMKDTTVHKTTKAYFAAGDPSNAEASQYGIVAARRDSFNELLWQTPVVSLTAQAFLFTIALGQMSARTRRHLPPFWLSLRRWLRCS